MHARCSTAGVQTLRDRAAEILCDHAPSIVSFSLLDSIPDKRKSLFSEKDCMELPLRLSSCIRESGQRQRRRGQATRKSLILRYLTTNPRGSNADCCSAPITRAESDTCPQMGVSGGFPGFPPRRSSAKTESEAIPHRPAMLLASGRVSQPTFYWLLTVVCLLVLKVKASRGTLWFIRIFE